jgi:hypothetical protein
VVIEGFALRPRFQIPRARQDVRTWPDVGADAAGERAQTLRVGTRSARPPIRAPVIATVVPPM